MIIALVGPTGIGKTKMSELLAEKYQAIIINADAIQVYKELNIGSSKIKVEEMTNLPHYLFDIKSILEDYNVVMYQKDLRKIIASNLEKNIIIVGGTGFYLMAGLYDYKFSKNLTNNNYETLSNEKLYALAIKKDPQMDIHLNNRIRLIRFLEKNPPLIKAEKLLYDVEFIGLTTKREILYGRINQRVDKMVEDGLVDEVKNLYQYKDVSRVLKSAIGYKEIIQHLDGKILLTEAISQIKQNTRHYAKRQFTWFKNKMNINWFSVDFTDPDITLNQIINYLENNKKNNP